jgi:hypothetical protein
VSMVTPQSVQQLAAIFIILFQMMFSGSNPTLNQLKNNDLLGSALLGPTFVRYRLILILNSSKLVLRFSIAVLRVGSIRYFTGLKLGRIRKTLRQH